MASAVIAVIAGTAGAAAGSAAVTALGIAGSIAGTLVGAVVGAVVGGAVSAAGAAIMGEDVGDAFLSGALTGAIGGGLAGYNAAATNATSTQADWSGINTELDAGASFPNAVDGRSLSGDAFDVGTESVFGTENLAGAETGVDVIESGGDPITGNNAAQKAAEKIVGTDGAEAAAETASKTTSAGAPYSAAAEQNAGFQVKATGSGLMDKFGEGLSDLWDGAKGMLSGEYTKGSLIQAGGGMLSKYADYMAAKEDEEEEDAEEEARLARLNASIDATPYGGYSFGSDYTS